MIEFGHGNLNYHRRAKRLPHFRSNLAPSIENHKGRVRNKDHSVLRLHNNWDFLQESNNIYLNIFSSGKEIFITEE